MSKKRDDPKHTGEAPSIGRVELYATVFITGAAVMIVEILGTRIIGPVFGVGLFVWSALLAVTLGSLAVGYYLGGVLVDRSSNARLMGVLVVAAGGLLGLTPAISQPILRIVESVGPRGGSLLGAALLFGPCLLLLGMLGPLPSGWAPRISAPWATGWAASMRSRRRAASSGR